MKITEISAGLILCLIAILWVNKVMAAEVLVERFYLGEETCDGIPQVVLSGVVNQCKEMGAESRLYTCSSFKSFLNPNCTGKPDFEATFEVGCQTDHGLPSLTQCETYPNEDIYLIKKGDSCAEDGEVAGDFTSRFIVLNSCMATGSTTSIKYALTGEGSTLTTTYYDDLECTTFGRIETLEVGKCVVTSEPEYEGGPQTVMKVSPGVIPTSAPTTEPPTPAESPTSNPGSDAMARSTFSIMALIAIIMAGVLMTIY